MIEDLKVMVEETIGPGIDIVIDDMRNEGYTDEASVYLVIGQIVDMLIREINFQMAFEHGE